MKQCPPIEVSVRLPQVQCSAIEALTKHITYLIRSCQLLTQLFPNTIQSGTYILLLETSVDDDVVGSTMSGWARACRPDLLITLSISIIVSKSFQQSGIYKVFIKSHFLKTIVEPKCNEVHSLHSHDIGVLVNI